MVIMTITCVVIMVSTTDISSFFFCVEGKELAGSGLGLGFGDLTGVRCVDCLSKVVR